MGGGSGDGDWAGKTVEQVTSPLGWDNQFGGEFLAVVSQQWKIRREETTLLLLLQLVMQLFLQICPKSKLMYLFLPSCLVPFAGICPSVRSQLRCVPNEVRRREREMRERSHLLRGEPTDCFSASVYSERGSEVLVSSRQGLAVTRFTGDAGENTGTRENRQQLSLPACCLSSLGPVRESLMPDYSPDVIAHAGESV